MGDPSRAVGVDRSCSSQDRTAARLVTRPALATRVTPPGSGIPASAPRSSLRELMSSLVNTLRRWYSTVRGLMNSLAPISGFVCLSLAIRAICASWGVRTSRVSIGAPAARSRRWPGARGGRARRTPRRRSGRSGRRRLAAARARRRAGSRDAAIRRRGAGRGRGGPRHGCARAARPPRGRAAPHLVRRSAARASRPRCRAPNRCRSPACARSGDRAQRRPRPSRRCGRLPRSAPRGPTRRARHRRARRLAGRPRAPRRSGRGRCSSSAVAQSATPSAMPSPRARRLGQPSLEQPEGLGLVAAPRRQHQPTRASAVPGRSRRRSRRPPRSATKRRRTLPHERGGTRDTWPRSGARGARPSRARRAARASRARTRARRPRDPAARRHASQSQRTSRAVNPSTLAERVERLPERRHTGRVALGEPRRQAVEEQVDRAWRLRRRRRSLSGLGSLADARLVAEATGVHRRRHRLEMGLASHRGVERLEAPGGIEQQRRSVAAARAGEHDLRAQPLQPRALKLVERGKLGGRQQLERRVRCPGVELRLRGSHGPPPPPRRIGGQLGRARQERRSRRRAPTGLRPVGRALQLVGHRLVGPGRRLRPMPGATIGIGIRIGRLGQRSMHFLAVAKVQRPGRRPSA